MTSCFLPCHETLQNNMNYINVYHAFGMNAVMLMTELAQFHVCEIFVVTTPPSFAS